MPQNPVRWFEIYVEDMPRAKKFYEGVFDVKLEALQGPGLEMWSFPMHMDQMGAAGALVKSDECPSGGNSTLVYFASDDCAIEEGRVEKLGGKIHKRKTSIGEYGFISMIYDTEGNLIGLHSMK